jgi:hypothetical protein
MVKDGGLFGEDGGLGVLGGDGHGVDKICWRDGK